MGGRGQVRGEGGSMIKYALFVADFRRHSAGRETTPGGGSFVFLLSFFLGAMSMCAGLLGHLAGQNQSNCSLDFLG